MFKEESLTEADMILRAKQGSSEAFELLVQENASFVFNLALRLTQNPQEAEDLSQEVFVRVWKALPNFRLEARFSTWLYRIVANLCYDRLPKLRRELNAIEINTVINMQNDDQTRQPEHKLLSSEQSAELHDAIDHLPQSYRLLITLRHLQGMSYDDIAEVTGQPLGTVKSGIYRARNMLKERILAYESQPG